MASTSDFRNGLCFMFKGEIHTIVSFLHVKPGKGPAFVRTKLRNIKTGRIIDNTFNSGVKVEDVRVERRQYQYLYRDEQGLNVMNTQTFEQISIPESMIDNSDLMKEGQIIEIQFHADEEIPLTAEMPSVVELVVTSTIDGEKGNTASSNALKPATVETGAELMVPMFINEGDIIRVSTIDRSYNERVRQ
ncbi:MAG TPA: elongation factor P [Draconibacterium sp.]|nr:elongation factor P [Draconibacterium sp.]HRX10451.1 elongation factor P [Draconibacterium sp.]